MNMEYSEISAHPPKESRHQGGVYENGARLVVSPRPNHIVEQYFESGNRSSPILLRSKDDTDSIVTTLPLLKGKSQLNGRKEDMNSIPITKQKQRRKKPLYKRMEDARNKQIREEEEKRNEARIKRKMELQKANFSLAEIREHIAKHDEMMLHHKKQFEELSPLRRLRHNRRQDHANLPPISDNQSILLADQDDSSVDTKQSFITQSGTRKKNSRKLKTKLNEKIKNDLVIEKIMKNKSKIEMEDRLKRKEEFSEKVKKYKQPSPRRVAEPISNNSSVSKVPSISSITPVRIIEDVGSLMVSQLQVSPRIPHVSPRASVGNLHKPSPRFAAQNLQSPFRVASRIDNFDDELQDQLVNNQVVASDNSTGLKSEISQHLRYEYPADTAESDGSERVSEKIDVEPYQRSQWIDQMLASDPDEDNLAEVYEAGFSMYLAEKGIRLP